MTRKLYLAYGSNLDMDQMLRRCPDAIRVGTATIEDYELVFRGNARHNGVANIEPCGDGMSVPVGVWSISESDEAALDRYEGWPWLYEKQTFTVRVNGKTVNAMAYVMTPGHRITPPSSIYLGTIAKGYDDFGFDPEPLMEASEDARHYVRTRRSLAWMQEEDQP